MMAEFNIDENNYEKLQQF